MFILIASELKKINTKNINAVVYRELRKIFKQTIMNITYENDLIIYDLSIGILKKIIYLRMFVD